MQACHASINIGSLLASISA
uniref:Uncharacterized protein n=1 Tax=Arundo donax TaxID=35708 RepID=A0A0A9C3V5_ARUDO